MAEKKNIFEIFKSKKEAFAQQPPDGAWHKLEQKLDNYSGGTNARTIRLKRLLMAASLVLLVGLVFAISYYRGELQERRLFASAVPENLETLNLDGDYESEIAAIHQVSARFANFQNIAFANISNSDLAINSREAPSSIANNIVPQAMRADTTPEQQYELVPADEIPARSYLRDLKPAAFERYDSTQQRSKKNRTFSGHKKTGLAGLYWLIGTWQEELPHGRSVEQWKMPDSATMKGTAWLIQGDDTVFTESIMLKDIDGRLVLYQAVKPDNKPVPFFQKNNENPRQWTFENAQYVYPKSIVLTGMRKDAFIAEMRGSADVPGLSSAQVEFLRKRHILFPDRHFNTYRAVRKMEKTDS